MLRKVLLLVLSGLIVSLFACSVSAQEIKVWWEVGYPGEGEAAVELFEQAYPDIKVELQTIPTKNMVEKMMLGIAADDMPNVVWGYNGRNSKWYHEGVTVPLQEVLSEETLADFHPGMQALHTIGGDLFMVPVSHAPLVYLLNKTVLGEAGISVEQISTDFTFEEHMEIARKVNNPPDVYSMIFHVSGRGGDYYMLNYFQMFGAEQYESGDYTQTTLNSEAGVRALEWMLATRDEGLVPLGAAGLNSAAAGKIKQSGKIAMHGGSAAWATADLWGKWVEKGIAGRVHEYQPVSVPHIEGVPAPGAFDGSTGLCVFVTDNEAAKQASFEFVRFINRPEIVLQILEFSHQFSCRKSVTPDFVLESEAHAQVQRIVERNGVADQGINSPFYIEVRDLRYPELQAAFMGSKSPKQALDDFAKALANLWK